MTKLLQEDIPRYDVTKNVQWNGITGKDFSLHTVDNGKLPFFRFYCNVLKIFNETLKVILFTEAWHSYGTFSM